MKKKPVHRILFCNGEALPCHRFIPGPDTMGEINHRFYPGIVGVTSDGVIVECENPANSALFMFNINRKDDTEKLVTYYDGGPCYFAKSHHSLLTTTDKEKIDKTLKRVINETQHT